MHIQKIIYFLFISMQTNKQINNVFQANNFCYVCIETLREFNQDVKGIFSGH